MRVNENRAAKREKMRKLKAERIKRERGKAKMERVSEEVKKLHKMTERFQDIELRNFPQHVTGIRFKPSEIDSGVTLGGIGAGTIEIGKDGRFTRSTIFNNMQDPYMLDGNFFAIYTNDGNKKYCKALQTKSDYGFEPVQNLQYIGHFPIVDIEYNDNELPVEVSLRAFSPFIPYDSKNSGLPVAIFDFSLKNKSDKSVDISILFSWINDIASKRTAVRKGSEGVAYEGRHSRYFMTWKEDILKKGEKKVIPIIHGIGDSYDDLKGVIEEGKNWYSKNKDEIASIFSESSKESPFVILKNKEIELKFNEYGSYAKEIAGGKNQGLTFAYKGKKHLERFGYGIDYVDGTQKKKAGLRYFNWNAEREPLNLKIINPTTIMDKGLCSYTKLETKDGLLEIELKNVLSNADRFVIHEFTIKNKSNRDLKDIELYNLIFGTINGKMEGNFGNVDAKDGIIYSYDNSGIHMGIGGVKRPSGYKFMTGGTLGQSDPRSLKNLAQNLESFTKYQEKDGFKGLLLSTKEKDMGYSIICMEEESELSWLEQWDWEGNGRDIHKNFSSNGELNNDNRNSGEGTALASKISLKPGQEKHIRFMLSWYLPDLRDSSDKFLGHMYTNWFKGPWEVAKYVANNYQYLYQKTQDWQDKIYSSTLPNWLKDALVNSLYFYARSSYWTKDNGFATCESATSCIITETIVCRFNGSFASAMLFPDLEINTMDRFAKFQNKDGAIPFAFGSPEYIDKPGYETQKTIDSSEFVLMVYRDYIWTGDETFFKRMFPVIRKAIRYAMTLDTDGDCLINSELSRQFYDDGLVRHGVSAYVSSIWLSALKAASALAEYKGDNDFKDLCDKWLKKGVETFEDRLWTGKYYRLYNKPAESKKSDICVNHQLAGQWYAYMLALGEIFPHSHIVTAIKTIEELNIADNVYGARNYMYPDGKNVTTGGVGYKHTFLCENFNLASLACYAGRYKKALGTAKRAYTATAVKHGRLSNTPCELSCVTGKTVNMPNNQSNPSIWALLPAYGGIQIDMLNERLSIIPKVVRNFSIPLFFPYLRGMVGYKTDNQKVEVTIENSMNKSKAFKEIIIGIPLDKVTAVEYRSPMGKRRTISAYEFNPKDHTLQVKEKINFYSGKTIVKVKGKNTK